MNLPQKEMGMSVGTKPCTFFLFVCFELFTVKFANKIVKYPVSIICDMKSVQLSHSAITLCYVEEMT